MEVPLAGELPTAGSFRKTLPRLVLQALRIAASNQIRTWHEAQVEECYSQTKLQGTTPLTRLCRSQHPTKTL